MRSWDAPGWDVKSYRQRIEDGEVVNLYKGEGRGRWNKKLIEEFSRVTYILRPDGRLARFSDDFSVAITIGIDINEFHQSLDGGSIPYYKLIASLNFFGFDPLYAAKRDEALTEIWKKAEGVFFRVNASNAINIGALKMMFTMGVASVARDYSRDYVRGKTSIPKPSLDPDTLKTRREKSKKYSGLYQGESGIDEALWESGQLEDAIDIMHVEFSGTLSKRDRSVRKGYGASTGYERVVRSRRSGSAAESNRLAEIFERKILNPDSILDNNRRIMAAHDAMAHFHAMENEKLVEYGRLGRKEKTAAMMRWWIRYKTENPGNIEALRVATRILGIEKLSFRIT